MASRNERIAAESITPQARREIRYLRQPEFERLLLSRRHLERLYDRHEWRQALIERATGRIYVLDSGAPPLTLEPQSA
jgi:hypothetical protein